MLRLLHVAVLWLSLLLPSLLCGDLLCFYRPILERERTFKPIVTQCPRDELCFKADGRFGNHSVLSAKGCMAEKHCSQVHSLPLKGTVYAMSYACCDWPYCNSCSGIAPEPFSITVTLAAVIVGGL